MYACINIIVAIVPHKEFKCDEIHYDNMHVYL